jgi:hypothetical protein
MSRRPQRITALALALVFLMSLVSPGLAEDVKADFGPGKYTANLVAGAKQVDVGDVEFFNDQQKLYVNVYPAAGWALKSVNVYVGNGPVPVKKTGADLSGFPWSASYGSSPAGEYTLSIDLKDELGVKWGWPWEATWTKYVSVKAEVVKVGTTTTEAAWAAGSTFFDAKKPVLGQWFTYGVQRPGKGRFVDAPVGGLGYLTETFKAVTDEFGSFVYFEGETIVFTLAGYPIGGAPADKLITPLHIFGTEQLDDPRVANMARLLQSLDADGDPKGKIYITKAVQDALAATALEWMDSPFYDDESAGFAFDFTDKDQIDHLIDGTIAKMEGVEGVSLRRVDAEEAVQNLAEALSKVNDDMVIKNVSKSPETASSKARIDFSTKYVPAQRADGTTTTIDYYDANGQLIETRDKAQPLVMAWVEDDPESGGSDVYSAVSLDDGNTWKRVNISRYASESSFTLANGEPYPAKSFKPSLQVLDAANGQTQVMIVWTSSFARQGSPRYAIETTATDPADDYPYDDKFYKEDIWGVSGSQGSTDYTELGFPEVGEIPYYVVWSARGLMDSDTGEVTWYKPERLTSGRRNAMQLVLAKAGNGAGWGITWQEDPEGIRPGSGDGPGAGWSGAIAANGTDIWYSFVHAEDFAMVDENFVSGGDPQTPKNDDADVDEFRGRPKALVPFSLPVRVSDNQMVNNENLGVVLGEDDLPLKDESGNYIPLLNDNDATQGTREYAYKLDGTGIIAGFIDVVVGSGETKKVVYTSDKRLLDGNTGGTRPALFLQGKKFDTPILTEGGNSTTLSAWTILAYEETKGLGNGSPTEHYLESDEETATTPIEDGDGDGIPNTDKVQGDIGKNIVYHSFDFMTLNKTTLVSGGTILNEQAVLHAPDPLNPDLEILVDENGNPTTTPVPEFIRDAETGEYVLDVWGNKIKAYENARRPRFLVQGKDAAVANKASTVAGTIAVMVFKMGEEGKGGASDAFIQRWEVKAADTGNPYAASKRAKTPAGYAYQYSTNFTSVTPTVWVEDNDKLLKRWTQDASNLNDYSWEYANESAQGQRGYLRGDFLLLAYDYTANFRAAENGNDIFNLHIRRSFDGGKTFTVAPTIKDSNLNTTPYKPVGTTVLWENLYRNPGEGTSEWVEVPIARGVYDRYTGTWITPGEHEPARNITRNTKVEVNIIEPRTTALPGTIANSPYNWTDPITKKLVGPDVNDPTVHWVFWGTGSLYIGNNSEEEDLGKMPYDLQYTFSRDYGDTWAYEEKAVSEESPGNYAGTTTLRNFYLAKDPILGEGEAQAKFSPSGHIAYVCYTDDEDAKFARIMPYDFPANQAPAAAVSSAVLQ